MTLDDVIETADVVITATGNRDIVTVDQMRRMKHNAVVGNIGHFDNEIDMAGLAAVPGVERVTIKPQVDRWVFPDGHAIIVLSEGRLLNLGNATGHPSFVMSQLVLEPGDRADRAVHARTDEYALGVHVLPEAPRREGRAAARRGARREADTAQAASRPPTSASPSTGPYKPDHYRY